jgi:hypothetical protein
MKAKFSRTRVTPASAPSSGATTPVSSVTSTGNRDTVVSRQQMADFVEGGRSECSKSRGERTTRDGSSSSRRTLVRPTSLAASR